MRDENSPNGGALLKVLVAASIGEVMEGPSIKVRRERYGIQMDFAANKYREGVRVNGGDLLTGPCPMETGCLDAQGEKPGGPGPANLKAAFMAERIRGV